MHTAIDYRHSADRVTPAQLRGFFVGWPNPPRPEVHLRLLQQSDEVVLAVDTPTDAVVGFITAITDGVLAAYIPFLEVLPAWQGGGIGQTLVARMLDRLAPFYMVDLLCDEALQPFYEHLGMRRAQGMMLRNYHRQSGQEASE